MYTKAKIFNLALNALLLQRQVANADTDGSNEAKVLRTVYDVAFATTLADLDLDSLSTQADLELVEEDPTDHWLYSYAYPTDCAVLRRLQSQVLTDTETTHVDKQIRIIDGEKVILTNQAEAVIEYISTEVDLQHLSAAAGLALSFRLATLAAPLITGKGAAKLIEGLEARYKIAKAEAQEQDKDENRNPQDPATESSWVETRVT